ncbi:MAG: FGGY family carbohydrate kinase [Opitutales bacterium]
MSRKVYLAADIGAGSGRVLAGVYSDGKIALEELCRFDNQPQEVGGSLKWDIEGVFQEIIKGVKLAVDRYGDDVKSIGVDTWGVDYALLDENDSVLETPYCYRDNRTDGMIDAAEKILPQSARYVEAGLQQLHFNTLYQLLAEKQKGDNLAKAKTLLFIPDLINFWLSGVKANEVTIASTSEMLSAKNGQWSDHLLTCFEIPKSILNELSEPGDVLGKITEKIADEVGKADLKVVATPSHDTAAAVAACPLPKDETSIFISSGTWSLMGVESENAQLTRSPMR